MGGNALSPTACPPGARYGQLSSPLTDVEGGMGGQLTCPGSQLGRRGPGSHPPLVPRPSSSPAVFSFLKLRGPESTPLHMALGLSGGASLPSSPTTTGHCTGPSAPPPLRPSRESGGTPGGALTTLAPPCLRPPSSLAATPHPAGSGRRSFTLL